MNPRQQKFTKTDLAKFENTWERLPHWSAGERRRTSASSLLWLEDRAAEFVARPALLRTSWWRRRSCSASAERIVGAQKFGGLQGQHRHLHGCISCLPRRLTAIDLAAIWRSPEAVSLNSLRPSRAQGRARGHQSLANGKNVTEWCKKEECWKTIKDMVLPLPSILEEPDCEGLHGMERR